MSKAGDRTFVQQSFGSAKTHKRTFATSRIGGFGDRDHPRLQIAHRGRGLAKFLSEISRRQDAPIRKDLRPLAGLLLPAMSRHSVTPDCDGIDTSEWLASVNWVVLEHLADEAAQGRDPRAGLKGWYYVAEVAFARGDFTAPPG